MFPILCNIHEHSPVTCKSSAPRPLFATLIHHQLFLIVSTFIHIHYCIQSLYYILFYLYTIFYSIYKLCCIQSIYNIVFTLYHHSCIQSMYIVSNESINLGNALFAIVYLCVILCTLLVNCFK